MRFFWIFCLLFFWAGHLPATVVEKIVAVVNDDVITASEVDAILHPLYEKYKQVYSGDELITNIRKARKEAIDQLIERKLITQEAKTQGIDVPQETMDRQMAEIQARFGGRENLIEALERDGITYEELSQKIRAQLNAKALVQQILMTRVSVSPQAIEVYYNDHREQFQEDEKIHAYHLFIKKEAGGAEEARKKAAKSLERIRQGEDFSVVVREMSEGPNADKGGDLGFFPRGTLIKDIEEVAFSLQPGDVSGVIESPIGFHILRVEARRKSRLKPLSEAYHEIEERLFQHKAAEVRKEWVSELKEKAYIEIFE